MNGTFDCTTNESYILVGVEHLDIYKNGSQIQGLQHRLDNAISRSHIHFIIVPGLKGAYYIKV